MRQIITSDSIKKTRHCADRAERFIDGVYAGGTEPRVLMQNNEAIGNALSGTAIGVAGLGNGLLIVAIELYFGVDAAERARLSEKGLRDIERIREGFWESFRGVAANPGVTIGVTVGVGLLYSALLLWNAREKARINGEMLENLALLKSIQAHSLNVCDEAWFQLQYEAIKAEDTAFVKIRHLLLDATEGIIMGSYLSFSIWRIAVLCAGISHAVVNPLPFAIAAFCLSILFCSKQIYDHVEIQLRKRVSMLQCEIELDTKKLSLLGEMEPLEKIEVDRVSERISVKIQQLEKAQRQLNSWLRWGVSAGNVVNCVAAKIKNNTLGFIGLANGAAFFASMAFKVSAGATVMAACGGPVGLSLAIIAIASFVLYALYKQYEKHQISLKNRSALFVVHKESDESEGVVTPLLIKEESDSILSSKNRS